MQARWLLVYSPLILMLFSLPLKFSLRPIIVVFIEREDNLQILNLLNEFHSLCLFLVEEPRLEMGKE